MEMVATKKGSPLILGLCSSDSKHGYIVASDINAIIGHTNKTLFLQENEILHVQESGSFHIYDAQDIVMTRSFDTIDVEICQIMKGSYSHFMEKEIFEQVSSIQQTMNGRITSNDEIKLGGIFEFLEMIQSSSRIVFIACGTSFHSCLAVRPLFESLTKKIIMVENSCDVIDRGVHVFPSDTCVFVSQSGETADTIVALRIAKEKRALCLGITNVVGSTIDRDTVCGIHVNAGTEIGVASTKSYTSQIVIMTMFALALARDFVSRQALCNTIIQSLRKLPLLIEEILSQKEEYERIAESLKEERHILFLGRTFNMATALEASLKLKEVSYVHCEGIIAGELKHGPLALIDEKVLVIVIATADEKMKSSIEQLISRKARIFILTDSELLYQQYPRIVLPKIDAPSLRPILDIIPFQLLSYYLALKKGYNVDQPRNLAKSVTVTD
jgi:glucosamine--fructose-6-phosphate aminotransferase (isomerizing)